MAVFLLRNYLNYVSGSTVAFEASVERSLIAQLFAVAATGNPSQSNNYVIGTNLAEFTIGGNLVIDENSAGIATPVATQGPRILPNGTILAFASLGTNTTMSATTTYFSEIFVAHKATWTGIGLLNGATVGTNNGLVALYDTTGALITTSAVAGALSAGANAFQNRAFLNTVTLQPGRYFFAYQQNGATATMRTWRAVDGGNQMTAINASTVFGTLPPTLTVPTTFTADVGPIGWLYQ